MDVETLPTEPTMPFVRMNDHEIMAFHTVRTDMERNWKKWWYNELFLKMTIRNFEQGRFLDNGRIIDINCWRFPIVDIENLGNCWSIGRVLRFGRASKAHVRHIYGTPVQLSFEEAREEIVELICKKRWFGRSQDRVSQKSFRESMAKTSNMFELIIGHPSTNQKWKHRFPYQGGIGGYSDDFDPRDG